MLRTFVGRLTDGFAKAPAPPVAPTEPPATEQEAPASSFNVWQQGPALAADIGRDFCQNGFTRLPGTFSSGDIAEMRRAAIGILPPNEKPYRVQFTTDAHTREPIRSIIFGNERLIGALRKLLGDDFLLINELSLQDCHYSGWHADTTSPEAKAGHDFHWSPRFLMVNVAVYLQDGGLDVVPSSYVRNDPLADTMLGRGTAPDPYGAGISVPSVAGDTVIFHLRTSHRATPMQSEERKLALFMIAGPNNDMTRRYREWLDQYSVMQGSQRPDIPEDFKAFLAEKRIGII
ncbi:phytanoyl-CoA dioxygenase family protein [Microbacteriaceae bacterium K1510]|nr:phytanoyl-CoA dioxygenase family protein [Microbacteriaceae bacterium K1510]